MMNRYGGIKDFLLGSLMGYMLTSLFSDMFSSSDTGEDQIIPPEDNPMSEDNEPSEDIGSTDDFFEEFDNLDDFQ